MSPQRSTETMGTDFYRAFEDLHRGSRALIQSRQEVYLPYVSALAAVHPQAPVLDLGCGRGEWLELLEARGILAHGVDLDDGMLQACREQGLDVRRGDAIEYLRAQPDASQAAVSAFHLVEHIPIDAVQALIREALRVLVPGGLLILETPNPENLVVGTAGFYMDPTHLRPLPPDLLAFLPQFLGFGRAQVLRLQEGTGLSADSASVGLIDVLAGVSPDYAVIAQKQPEAFPAGPHKDAIEEAFSRKHGVSLHELALRLDAQWAQRFWELGKATESARAAARVAEVAAETAARRAGTAEERVAATELRTLQSEQRAARAEQRTLESEHRAAAAAEHATAAERNADAVRIQLAEVAALQREIVRLHHELIALRQSRSWRITRPLRWITEQRLALREQGLGERLRRLAARLGFGTHPVASEAARSSRAAEASGSASAPAAAPAHAEPTDTASAQPPMPAAAHTPAHPASAPQTLSDDAAHVHEELLRALAAREAAAGKL